MEAVHEGREFPMLMSLHLSILSRLILASHSLFAALCLTSATRIGSNHNDVAGKVKINPEKIPSWTSEMEVAPHRNGAINSKSIEWMSGGLVLLEYLAVLINQTKSHVCCFMVRFLMCGATRCLA